MRVARSAPGALAILLSLSCSNRSVHLEHLFSFSRGIMDRAKGREGTKRAVNAECPVHFDGSPTIHHEPLEKRYLPPATITSPCYVLGICAEVGLPQIGVQLVHAVQLLLQICRIANNRKHQKRVKAFQAYLRLTDAFILPV